MEQKLDFILDPSLVLYLPLHKLDGSPFMSDDAYGHLCTVTGALWRPDGRDFDGDDYINLGLNKSTLELTTLTVIAWIKPTTSADHKNIFGNGDYIAAQTGYSLNVRQNDDGVGPDKLYSFIGDGVDFEVKYGVAVTYGSWQMVTQTINDATDVLNLYQNTTNTLVDEAITRLPAFGGDNRVVVGSAWGSTPAYASGFLGSIGEVWVYNRVLSPLEIQHNYLATKWRYR